MKLNLGKKEYFIWIGCSSEFDMSSKNNNGGISTGRCKGVARGPPPQTEKNCCRKMVLFPKALFLVTNFPK